MLRGLCPRSGAMYDHFLYRVGGGAGRPPSLSLLPAWHVPPRHGKDDYVNGHRVLLPGDTGILRCVDGELLVAQVQ
jgi:hypothetical protein